jgi:hypothetical protein
MADDDAVKNIAGLPTNISDDLPEYFWKPKLGAINDALAGKPNAVVDGDSHGKQFRFFIDHVLKDGVPGTTRAAFEKDALATTGPIDAAKAADLLKKYPGVANAYSPDDWAKNFANRGLDAKKFGAAW